MDNNTKRYVVYGFDRDCQENYMQDYDIELFEALESGRRDPMDYGEQLGEFDSEDEANECAVKYADSHRSDDDASIYDREEKIWFN